MNICKAFLSCWIAPCSIYLNTVVCYLGLQFQLAELRSLFNATGFKAVLLSLNVSKLLGRLSGITRSFVTSFSIFRSTTTHEWKTEGTVVNSEGL